MTDERENQVSEEEPRQKPRPKLPTDYEELKRELSRRLPDDFVPSPGQEHQQRQQQQRQERDVTEAWEAQKAGRPRDSS